jgi:hypothetical protein
MTNIIKALSLTFFIAISISEAHANEQVFLVCKTLQAGGGGVNGTAVTAGCINAYNPTPKKVCSGKGDTLCSTISLEDLCINVGREKSIDFQRFSSGLGTFKTEKACVDSCMKEYDGKMSQFGYKCLKTVSK